MAKRKVETNDSQKFERPGVISQMSDEGIPALDATAILNPKPVEAGAVGLETQADYFEDGDVVGGTVADPAVLLPTTQEEIDRILDAKFADRHKGPVPGEFVAPTRPALDQIDAAIERKKERLGSSAPTARELPKVEVKVEGVDPLISEAFIALRSMVRGGLVLPFAEQTIVNPLLKKLEARMSGGPS